MNEAEFISSVDCCFPYDDREAALQAISEACTICPNTAFTVAHELARVPRGVSKDVLLGLLSELSDHFNHPLKDLVLAITKRMIVEDRLPLEEVLSAMDEISHCPGEWQALNIAYFSLQDYPEEIEEKCMELVDEVYEHIKSTWGAARSSWPA